MCHFEIRWANGECESVVVPVMRDAFRLFGSRVREVYPDAWTDFSAGSRPAGEFMHAIRILRPPVAGACFEVVAGLAIQPQSPEPPTPSGTAHSSS